MISNLEDLRDVSITDVVSKWAPVKNHFACCPIHGEKSPSLHVNERKNFFKCFGCGAGGDAIKFVQFVEHCDFITAAERVAAIGNVAIEFDNIDREAWLQKKEKQRNLSETLHWAITQYSMYLHQSEDGKAYLAKRGITIETAETFMLGFAPESWSYLSSLITGIENPKLAIVHGLIAERETGGFYDRFRNRLIFPYFNEIGEYVSLSGRTTGVPSDNNPKTMKGNNSEIYTNDSFLYGLYQAMPAIKQHKCVHIVEGEIDVLQMYQAGVENVVASGNNRIKEPQCTLLKKYTNKIVLVPDNDSHKEKNSGFNAVIDNLRLLLKYGFTVEIFELPEANDPDSFCLTFKNQNNDTGTEMDEAIVFSEENA